MRVNRQPLGAGGGEHADEMPSRHDAGGGRAIVLAAPPGRHLFDAFDRRPRAANIWPPEPDGFYIDPSWCSERLFASERFTGSVWDPAVGIGRIAEAARHAGYSTYATDIADRGYQHFDGCGDFLRCEQARGDNIICNPPYHICRAFLEHALKLARERIAMIWLARRLNAARWLADTPLVRIYLLTPRPSMPPGHIILAGAKPRGGTQDFCWLVFDHRHTGAPELRWLHRDGARP